MATDGREDKIDIGSVVQRGFSTLGRHAAGFVALSLLLAGLPSFAMNYVAASVGGTREAFGAYTLAYGALVLVTFVAAYVLQAALVRSSVLDFNGRPVDLPGSLMAALMLALPIVGLTILSSVAIGFGMLLFFVPGIILYVMWIVALPVLVEEQPGVIASMKRSAQLTSGSRWRIFGLILLFIIFAVLVSAASELVNFFGEAESPLAAALASGASSAATELVMATMLAALYVELRTVKEGEASESLVAIFE